MSVKVQILDFKFAVLQVRTSLASRTVEANLGMYSLVWCFRPWWMVPATEKEA